MVVGGGKAGMRGRERERERVVGRFAFFRKREKAVASCKKRQLSSLACLFSFSLSVCL